MMEGDREEEAKRQGREKEATHVAQTHGSRGLI